MNLFDFIDPDKFLNKVLPLVFEALNHWRRGQPQGETEAMSHITSALNTRKNRRCDLGTEGEVLVGSDLYILHRKGVNSTDKYGSDLALTVNSTYGSYFSKTCFIQFKLSVDEVTTIRRDQILDAKADSAVFERGFIVAIDPVTLVVRVKELKAVAVPTTAQANLSVKGWMTLHTWLIRWLRCSVGAISVPIDGKDVISTWLEKYKIPEPLDGEEEDITQPPALSDAPLGDRQGFVPARSWVRVTMSKAVSPNNR